MGISNLVALKQMFFYHLKSRGSKTGVFYHFKSCDPKTVVFDDFKSSGLKPMDLEDFIHRWFLIIINHAALK